MSAISELRGPSPFPSAAGGDRTPWAAAAPARRLKKPEPDRPLLPALPARLAATLVLVAFGALHWMIMLEPAEPRRAWYGVGAAAATALALIAAGRLAGPLRAAATAAAVALGAALALLGGGVADELLLPGRWGDLASTIGRGLEALPGARVPYRGLDEQLRLLIPLGGTVLAAVGALLAFVPRRRGRTGYPVAALIALVTLYAVPAVAVIFEQEFLRGALLALLVVAFLRLERLRRRDGGAALAVGAVAATLALAVAPALDGLDPWWDYESWTQSAAGSKSTEFQWDHEYGPLDWPRDGRELLRIRSPQRAYWKADELDDFNGRRWVRDSSLISRQPGRWQAGGVEFARLRRWSFGIRVNVRNLRSDTLPVAGTAEDVLFPRRPSYQVRPGIWSVMRQIRRGDAYTARVYVPQPSNTDLRQAGASYVGWDLERFQVVTTEGDADTVNPDGRTTVHIPSFGAEPVRIEDGFNAVGDLPDTSLERPYELSRRLLAGAETPLQYVRAIERYLSDGFTYSESPPEDSRTLDGFLFDTRVGYCQQFSGAMALLLRLGGVPARVATGFAPGSYDRSHKEYVVRDVDAHSWVEAWFPGIGWVVFDPTPSSAPPRSQAGAGPGLTAGIGDVRDRGTTLVNSLPTGEAPDDGPPWGWIVAAVVLAAVAFVLLRRGLARRRHPAATTLELERALRIAAGGVAPGTTLTALEARFAGSPPAVGYVRALRAQRYATQASGPTPAQRRGLRRALAHGRGPVGRMRAYLALPPRLPHPRRR